MYLRCSFSYRNPIVFENGGVFLATATISLDKSSISWTAPKMLEPALIIIVGGIVLVTVIALYLPIFSISDI